MGLASWAKVLKYLILLFNLIFFICGISMICIGAAISIKFEITPAVLANLPQFDSGLAVKALTSAPMACVIAGIIVMIVVMFGCIGAWREGPCLLGLFSFLMIICVIVQFGAAVTISSWSSITDSDEGIIQTHFKDMIVHYNSTNPTSRAIDSVQTMLKCCGSTSPEDWRENTMMNNTENGAYHMPKSCCQNDIVEGAACDSDVAGKYMFHDGCITTMMDVIESNAKYLVGSVVTIALLEVLGIVFSCMLLKKIRQSTGYEPQFNNY